MEVKPNTINKEIIKKFNYENNVFFTGRLVFYESSKALYFVDKFGKHFDFSRVFFLTPVWNDKDGHKRLPLPDIRDAENNLTEEGDQLIYNLIDTDIIMVLGSIYNYKDDHKEKELQYKKEEVNYDECLIKENKNRYYMVKEDGEGNLLLYMEGKEEGKSSLSIRLTGKDKEGYFNLIADGKISINQKDEKGEQIINQIFMDNTEGEESIKIIDKHQNYIETKKDGTIIETPKIRIGKDETVKKILIDLFLAIQKMTHQTNTGATVPQPINWSEFDAIKERVNKFMEI